MNIALLKELLNDKSIEIKYFDTIGSTNKIAKEYGEKTDKTMLFIAKAQTCGRGRLGHTFYSPSESGLYFSLLFHPEEDGADAIRYTKIAAIAAIRAIDTVTMKAGFVNLQCRIKPINDIYINGKKICGILTEGAFREGQPDLKYAVVGVGINVFEPDGGFPDDIKNRAGSVFGRYSADFREIYGLHEKLCAYFVNEFSVCKSFDGALNEYASKCISV